ncbi:hypothetical protein MMC13_007760 [Lambiella insularis]|nr:hypothetical protein [Lambiella insularis]
MRELRKKWLLVLASDDPEVLSRAVLELLKANLPIEARAESLGADSTENSFDFLPFTVNPDVMKGEGKKSLGVLSSDDMKVMRGAVPELLKGKLRLEACVEPTLEKQAGASEGNKENQIA